MTRGPLPTKMQQWFRDYSQHLAVSFSSSSRFEHNVASGKSREHQILDVLKNLLPTCLSVEENPIIVDSTDEMSRKFDGALVDRTLWPRLFTDGDATVFMIESVRVAIEVKSSLVKAELDDIFKKSTDLRGMSYDPHGAGVDGPLVTAFAYHCPNRNLSFFDFAISSRQAGARSPSLICVLNDSLFGLAETLGGKSVAVDAPHPDAVPILYTPAEDTLLLYIYFLSRWAAKGTESATLFRSYSDALFSGITGFCFEADFLDAVRANSTNYQAARNCFARRGQPDLDEMYRKARVTVGLSPSQAK